MSGFDLSRKMCNYFFWAKVEIVFGRKSKIFAQNRIVSRRNKIIRNFWTKKVFEDKNELALKIDQKGTKKIEKFE